MGVNDVLYKLIEERQRLIESAATLDETYHALGVLPDNPRVLEYSQMWNSIYGNVSTNVHGEELDKYAMLVANQTVKRYLDAEWEKANSMLTGEYKSGKIEVAKK